MKLDIELVKEYFYDTFDLHINIDNKDYFIDVKSVLTKKTPSIKWTFLYPVVQVNRRKSGTILAYCVVNNLIDISTLNSFVLARFISH